jgi:hypothetical protein
MLDADNVELTGRKYYELLEIETAAHIIINELI